MNQTKNQHPQGNEEERLALAFGRVCSPTDDVSPSWLGSYYLSEQFREMDTAARQRNLTVLVYLVGYRSRGPGVGAVLRQALRLAQERGVQTLLVPTKRHLACGKGSEPPYYWEQKFADAGIDIVEALPEELL